MLEKLDKSNFKADMKKVICPECGNEMELYGIFEGGELKFCCPACNRMLNSIESYKLGISIDDYGTEKV